jgi:hypothetical protein
MNDDYKYMVRVSCLTYNHAPYIEDAMDGFCMQETTFPFVCTIMDDASTDGEPEVIKDYLQKHFDLEDKSAVRNEEMEDYNLIFARHKTNNNCHFAVLLLKYNHYSIKKSKMPYMMEWVDGSKYVAICEGDDYWIVADKLQRQVEFLENHPDYGMCYCNFQVYDVVKDVYVKNPDAKYDGIYDLILKNYIATLTTIFRQDLSDRYLNEINPSSKNWKMGDYPRWLWMELESKIYYIDEVVATYRRLPKSSSHSTNYQKQIAFLNSSRDIQLFYAEKYKLKDVIIDKINDVYYRELSLVLKGKDNEAYITALKSIRKKTLKELLKLLFSFTIK